MLSVLGLCGHGTGGQLTTAHVLKDHSVTSDKEEFPTNGRILGEADFITLLTGVGNKSSPWV